VEHQKKADYIVDSVLQRLDLDNDGRISPDELEKIGLDGLPNFEGMGAEGHHYDVESGKSISRDNYLHFSLNINLEFFLHHEGQLILVTASSRN
jgi:hypothetical protein